MNILRIMIHNPVGLHARPASLFVSEANRFQVPVNIRNVTTDSEWVNAKSILSVLALGVENNHEIELAADGADGLQALDALHRLLALDC